MAQDPPRTTQKARLRFETLLSGICGRFAKLPPDRIDREIEGALREIAVFFDVGLFCGCFLSDTVVPGWGLRMVEVGIEFC